MPPALRIMSHITSGPVTQSADHELPGDPRLHGIPDHDLDRARSDFGQMLKRWRTQNGWSGKTPSNWYQAAPSHLKRQVASATWTGFELGRAVAPSPETFLALERMNVALHDQDFGPIADRKLRDRLAQGRPILLENGQPWSAGDFFQAFIGRLDPPEHLRGGQFDGEARAQEFRNNLRQHAARAGLGEVVALLQLLRHCRNAEPRDLSAIEAVVTTRAAFPSAAAADLADEALAEWARATETA